MILVATEAYSQQPTSNPSVCFVCLFFCVEKCVCVQKARERRWAPPLHKVSHTQHPNDLKKIRGRPLPLKITEVHDYTCPDY